MLRIVTHPVHAGQWCVVGPSTYDPAKETVWFGPDSIWACIEAKRLLVRI